MPSLIKHLIIIFDIISFKYMDKILNKPLKIFITEKKQFVFSFLVYLKLCFSEYIQNSSFLFKNFFLITDNISDKIKKRNVTKSYSLKFMHFHIVTVSQKIIL